MGEDSVKTIMFGLVLFVAFSWLVLSLTVNFANEYGIDSQDIGNGSLDHVAFQNTAETIEGNASGYRARFDDGNLEDIDDPSGMFSIVTDMVNLITAPFRLLNQILENVLGIPSLVITVVLGLLAIALILGIWRVLRSGS